MLDAIRRRGPFAALTIAALAACAPAASTRPAPERPDAVEAAPQGNTSGTAAPKTAPASAPKDGAKGASNGTPEPPMEAPPAWQRLDPERDGVEGARVDRALTELLAGRRPQRRVVVAVIDGGIDTLHPQLRPILWRNEREVAGNGVDDDRNGFVDDAHGWSMIPALPGDTGRYDTMELTRLYAACRGTAAGRGLARPGDDECATLGTRFAEEAAEAAQMGAQVTAIRGMLTTVTARLRAALRTDTLTAARVRAFAPTNADETNARAMWLRLDGAGIDSAALAGASKQVAAQRWQLDTLFDPRATAHDPQGSADVMGPDAEHGTHVAGIIGALARPDGTGGGIAPNVAIMAIRAVPDGDERDAEVARAIRYAVDNGAQVVNMSFGKGYSPGKPAVDSAVRYAESRGVLLVHAAGNDGADNDKVPSFPNRRYRDGGDAANWIEVGAISWKGGEELPAEFSNHGATMVDLFAPGVDITATVPGGGLEENSGTSMAAPVVSGVAALLLSYFPELTPLQVRQVIVESARGLRDREVTRPGEEGGTVRFGTLSRTGGVIDAYAAVQRAIALTRPVP